MNATHIEITEATIDHVTVIVGEQIHKVSRKAITAALSWMVDSGETACRLSRSLRLSLAQWLQLRDAIGAVELAGRGS